MVSFFVAGTPVTQGSKKAFVNRHTGRAVVVESAGDRLKLWRFAMRSEAQAAADGAFFIGPVEVTADFILPLPKSAPKRRRIWPVKRGLDVDKALRAALDSLTGVLFTDDAQVIRAVVSKDYGDRPGVHITVTEKE